MTSWPYDDLFIWVHRQLFLGYMWYQTLQFNIQIKTFCPQLSLIQHPRWWLRWLLWCLRLLHGASWLHAWEKHSSLSWTSVLFLKLWNYCNIINNHSLDNWWLSFMKGSQRLIFQVIPDLLIRIVKHLRTKHWWTFLNHFALIDELIMQLLHNHRTSQIKYFTIFVNFPGAITPRRFNRR